MHISAHKSAHFGEAKQPLVNTPTYVASSMHFSQQ